MFKHSIKVPRLYKIAAKIAKEVYGGIGSVKHLVYEHCKKHPNIKAIYALVTTLFQKTDEIERLLKRSQFFTKEPRADPWLSKILIVELLWGTKRLPGDSTPEKTVKGYEQIFKAHLTDLSLVSKEIRDNKAETKPRYVRINTLSISLNEATEGFRDEGWNLCKYFDKTDYKGFLNKITSLGEDEFLIDIHVPNLLIFPPKTEFYNHRAYKNGSLILQDKASCLPVHILNPPPGSVVLDMCAAPGMKTTQLAAVMNDQGTVYAVERDPKRFETLNKIVETSGASCVKTENKDVLTCNANDFPGIEYIIVDPSCSGSGLTDRLEFEQKKSEERIEKLAGFQIKILRSALTRYPGVKRVVYSTCSIYPEENEDVVRQVLETNAYFKLVSAKEFVNNTWQNFGSSDYGEIGKYCLYAKPHEDLTNGFFVAVFERLGEGEENQFFNTKIYNYKKHVQKQERRKEKRGKGHEISVDTQEIHQTTLGHDDNSNRHTDVAEEEIGDLTVDARLKRKKGKVIKERANKYKNEHEEKHDNLFNENSGVELTKSIHKKKMKTKYIAVDEPVSEETEEINKKKKHKQPRNYLENSDENDAEKAKLKKKKKRKTVVEVCEETLMKSNDFVVGELNCEFSSNGGGSAKKKKHKETATGSSEIPAKKKINKFQALEGHEHGKEIVSNEIFVNDTADVVKKKKKRRKQLDTEVPNTANDKEMVVETIPKSRKRHKGTADSTNLDTK